MIALKLPFHFDIKTILDEINTIPKEEFVELYSVNIKPGSVEALHLIQPKADLNLNDAKPEFEATPRLQNLKYLTEINNKFPCRKETFRIHKILPGGEIKKHRDVDTNFENGLFRIHIPVLTNDLSFFNLNGENIPMRPGECWYVDINLEHYVQNHGKEDRIHLIMDCEKNDWWSKIFKNEGYESKFPNQFIAMTMENLVDMRARLEDMAHEGSKGILLDLQEEINRRQTIPAQKP